MRFVVVASLLILAGCTDVPACRYWADVSIGKGLVDESEVPMLPDNPFWTANGSSAAPAATESGQDPCAGEPGHPGRAPG